MLSRYIKKVTKEYLAQQHEAVAKQDSKPITTDLKILLNFNDKYDQYRPQFEEKLAQYADI